MWLLHPLWGRGYQFWSGIGSDVGELAIVVAVWTWIVSHNCHVRRCPRPAWHPDPTHGHPVCKRHHPHSKSVRSDGAGGSTLLED